MAYRASVLASPVQYGTITFAAGDTTKDATINAVVLANSVVVWLGNEATTAAGNSGLCKVAFTSTTNVRGTRNTAANTATIVNFVVMEYWPNLILSNQDVDIVMSGVATNTATITTVNTAKAMLVLRGSITTNAGVTFEQVQGRLTLTNGTTVTANRNSPTGSLTMSGTVLEFR